MAVASLVLGIIGVIFAFAIPAIPIGLILGILAIVLAVLAKKALVAKGMPTGMATAGLGIISAAIGGIVFAACLICYGAATSAANDIANSLNDLKL